MKPLKKRLFYIFSNFPLKIRLLISYLILCLLILATTSIMLFRASKKALIEHATTSSQQQLTIITNNLSEKIGHISNYAITLSINSRIAEIIKNNPTVPSDALKRYDVNSTVTDQAMRIIGLHENIYDWDILDTSDQWFHCRTNITKELSPYLNSKLLSSLKTNPEFRFTGPVTINSRPMFIGLKPMMDIDTAQYLGTIVLLIEETNISSVFQNLPNSELQDFYIVNSDNRILSSSHPEGVYQPLGKYCKISAEDLDQLNSRTTAIAKINGVENLIIKRKCDAHDWYVINMIPLTYLTVEHNSVLQAIILISVLLLLLSFLLSLLCTKTVTAPIWRLASKMEIASRGNLNVTANYHSKDEISILYTQFNNMIRRIHTLLENIYEEQNTKREIEIKLLQSQINPHFLYNTLNMICALIELKMHETAVKAISSLSSFYRNSLSKGKYIIPLEQELELTRQYLYIQSLRFMEYVDYDFNMDIDFDSEETFIPKLTLQPILENIFVHALSDKKVHIRIYVHREDKTIHIEITDNGIGMTPNQLENLNRSLYSTSNSHNTFGLPSIHQRISLLFGNEYGLSIKSKQNEFTSVNISIPEGRTPHENFSDH